MLYTFKNEKYTYKIKTDYDNILIIIICFEPAQWHGYQEQNKLNLLNHFIENDESYNVNVDVPHYEPGCFNDFLM